MDYTLRELMVVAAARGDPFSFSKGNFIAFVSKTLGLVVPARQRTRPNDLHADPNAQANAELGFHPLN